ncbi:unnamed protein product [Polarella glacialis]|uniref:Uncharacterized protein n=1 Tax=Polarella glacialis TaxID=89957 RepID=A0A813IPS2_POLGL|nr:unnamed protein product [Polarella glacialis]
MPALFAQSLFHDRPEVLRHVVGNLALYLLGWNLSFWSVGYALIESAANVGETTGKLLHGSARDVKDGRRVIVETVQRVLSKPPVIGVLVGLAVGLLPPLQYLFLPAADGLSSPPLAPLFRAAVNLGAAAVPGSTLVLAGSLALGRASGCEGDDVPATSRDMLERLLSWRSLALVALVRLVALPMVAGLGLCSLLGQQGLQEISSTSVGQALMYLILAQVSVPSACNSTLIPQLLGRPDISAAMARVQVGIYLLAVPFVCLWLAIWLRVVGL